MAFRLSHEASLNNTVTHDVIELAVSDGCGAVSLRIETTPGSDDDPMKNVRELLAALDISKVRAEDIEDQSMLEWSTRPKRPKPSPTQAQ